MKSLPPSPFFLLLCHGLSDLTFASGGKPFVTKGQLLLVEQTFSDLKIERNVRLK